MHVCFALLSWEPFLSSSYYLGDVLADDGMPHPTPSRLHILDGHQLLVVQGILKMGHRRGDVADQSRRCRLHLGWGEEKLKGRKSPLC